MRSWRARSCVLDGEIVCLAPGGRLLFQRLLFRRDWPHFVAFDVLAIDSIDLRGDSSVQRKRRLRAIMPRVASGLVYMDHVRTRGARCSPRCVRATSQVLSRSGAAAAITPR
jgi:ATP-dependent DNA ligase